MTPPDEIIRVAEQLAAMDLYGASQLIYRLARERDTAWREGRDAARQIAEAYGNIIEVRERVCALKSPYEPQP